MARPQVSAFHRDQTNRLYTHLAKPRLIYANTFQLPREATLHYLGNGPHDPGPPSSYPLFREIKKVIQVQHVLETSTHLGNPTLLSTSVEESIRAYHNRNRRYKRVYNAKVGTREATALYLVNYSNIERRYRYLGNQHRVGFYWHHNLLNTIVKEMNRVLRESLTQQFLFIDLPKSLPGPNWLKKISGGTITDKEYETLGKHFGLFLIWQMWVWLGPDRKDSILALLDEKYLNRVYFVLEDSGVYTVCNLGDLNGFRKADGNNKGADPKYLRLKWLQLCLMLTKVRNKSIEEIESDYEKDLEQSLNDEASEPDLADDQTEAPVEETDYQDIQTLAEAEERPVLEVKKLGKEGSTKIERVELDDITDTMTVVDIGKEEELNEQLAHEERLLNEQLEEQLKVLETLNQREEEVIEAGKPKAKSMVQLSPEGAVQDLLDRLAEEGNLSASEYKRYQSLSKRYQELEVKGVKLVDYVKRQAGDTEVKRTVFKDQATVTDKNMLSSSLKDWSSKYIRESLDKDVARMVLNVQQAGICITDYQVERTEDAMGEFDHYSIKINPVVGSPSTLRFKLPAVSEEGVIKSSGIQYRLRIQKGDIPIRKVNSKRVALTSYYGKVFVDRSEKKTANFGKWLCNNIRAAGLDKDNPSILETRTANVFNHEYRLPYLYTTLAKEFRSVTTASHYFYFDYLKREAKFGEAAIRLEENGKYVVFGMNKKKQFLFIDDRDVVYVYDGQMTPLGDFVKLIGMQWNKAPLECAEVSVMGKVIPVGIALGYEMGLSQLLSLLNVRYRRVPDGKPSQVDPTEYAVRFADETLYFSRYDRLASLIMAGFVSLQKQIKEYPISLFDRQDVYLNILEHLKITIRYLNELNLMNQMFVDPITLELLRQMKEPETFRGLLIRACELLLRDDHPREVAGSQMRYKGYERLAGAVYTEVVRAIRQHNARGAKGNYPIELNPQSVWLGIAKDPALTIVEGLNPVQNLKGYEAVTFGGTGGRSSTTMVERTRGFDPDDLGVMSEATVDSGNVGINAYLCPDPQLTSIYGLSEKMKIDPAKPNVARLFSTSSLLSVGAEKDDSKRRGFINVMHDHTVPCQGYQVTPVRTGYEQVIAKRTGKDFATVARLDGKVTRLDSGIMEVSYVDGSIDRIPIGRTYGSSGGLTVPHTVMTDLKVGDSFKQEDILSYNPAFFVKDAFNEGALTWKAGTMARVLLAETQDTIEDSCAVSPSFSAKMVTYQTKVKSILVNFDQEVHRLVKIGADLQVDDPLCIIEDSITSESKLFDEESIETLKALSNMVPKASLPGRVERIEVFYNGYKEDMSDSLKAIADTSDKRLYAFSKALGKNKGKGYVGNVSSDFRIEGNPLGLDQAVIQIYMTATVPAHEGD